MVQPVAFSRNEIINAGVRNGLNYDQIGNALQGMGYAKDFNPLTVGENWRRLPGNIARNASDFARDLRTFGGILVEPFVQADKEAYKAPKGKKLQAAINSFRRSVTSDPYRKIYSQGAVGALAGTLLKRIGPVGGAALGVANAITGGPKGVINAFLSPYNTSVDQITSGNFNLGRTMQGVMDNPLYALLDTAPLTMKAGSKIVNNIPDNAPKFIRQIFPPESQRKFNRAITQSMLNSRADLNDLYKGQLMLETMPLAKRNEILRNVITNTGNLNDGEKLLANTIKSNLIEAKNKAIEKGHLDPEIDKINTTAEYIMYMLPKHNLLHDDIVNILTGGELRDVAKNELSLKPHLLKEINKLAKDGYKLTDEGKITMVSQAMSPALDPMGNVRARDVAKTGHGYFGTNRVIGKQDIDTWASRFDDNINWQLNNVLKGVEFENTIDDLINKYNMNPMTKKEATEFASSVDNKDKIAFSHKAFKDFIKSRNLEGREYDIGEALRASAVPEEGAVAFNKLYIDMLENAFKKAPNTANRRMLNSFKKVVLANPHWIALNRIGNITNHLMNGGTLKDYFDIRSVKNIIPKQLQHQTSFGAYLRETENGLTSSTGFLGTSKKGINKFLRAFDRFKTSEKSLKDLSGLASDTLTGLFTDVTANPFYKAEATLEYMDRAANFIRQCKRYAEKNKLNWKDVLKKSETDKKLFATLNEEVNKALGDYVGRNYAMPYEWYDQISEWVPFYRFLTQTGRTTANQLIKHPLAFNTTVTLPSRIGNPISEAVLNMFNLDPESYSGGIPYNIEGNNEIRMVGIEPVPVGTIAENASDVIKGRGYTSILSPFLTTIPQMLMYMKNGRIPSSPGLREWEAQGMNKKDYRQGLPEVVSFGANQMLDLTNHLYRSMHTIGPELVHGIFGGGQITPYDTNAYNPDPKGFNRLLKTELLGKWLGAQTRSSYKNKKVTKAVKKKEIARKRYYQKNVKQKQNRSIN